MKKMNLLALLIFSFSGFAADKLNIIASTKPIHSLASQISGEVNNIDLLISNTSPHDYQLKPNDIKKLNQADLILWTGREFETFLPPILDKLAPEKALAWENIDDISMLLNRTSEEWSHEHNEEEEHHHHHHHEGEEHHHHHHHHGHYDLHLWLSIRNSAAYLKAIAHELSQRDPKNKEIYQKNLAEALLNIEKLQSELRQELKNVNQAYLVFHDAYQYFEKDFALNARGSIRVSPEHEINPQRLLELEEIIKKENVVCIFREPQFSDKILAKLNSDVKRGELDPLGADIPAGKDAYGNILRNLAKNLKNCLQ